MRISVEPGDPGYVPPSCCRGVRVWLNGVERLDCVMADEEKREAKFLARDTDGRLQIDRERGEIKQRVEYGDVRVELPAHLTPQLIAQLRARAAKGGA